MQPGIEATTGGFEKKAHDLNTILVPMIVDETVLPSRSLARYRGSFLNIALLFSTKKLGAKMQDLALGFEQIAGMRLCFIGGDGLAHLYRLCAHIPSRVATSETGCVRSITRPTDSCLNSGVNEDYSDTCSYEKIIGQCCLLNRGLHHLRRNDPETKGNRENVGRHEVATLNPPRYWLQK